LQSISTSLEGRVPEKAEGDKRNLGSSASRKSRFPQGKCCSAFIGNALPGAARRAQYDALGTADETEPVHVLVLSDFADEFSAMGTQAREDVIDIVDGEHDAPYAERVHRCVLWLRFDRRRRVELGQLNPTVAVRGPHRRDLALNVLKPNDKVHPASLEWHLALQLHTKLDKKRLRSLKVVDHDKNVVNPLKRHLSSSHPWLETDAPCTGSIAKSKISDGWRGRTSLHPGCGKPSKNKTRTGRRFAAWLG